MDRRIVVQWTATAKNQLARLPKKVRRGLLDKAGALREVEDPRQVHKPLVGPLQGLYRITYARYRAIYSVEEKELAGGGTVLHIYVRFVAAGQRKERDRKDIYTIAQKLVDMGLIDLNPDDADSDELDSKT